MLRIKTLIAFGLLFASLAARAQLDRRIGDWRAYLSHQAAIKSVERAGLVYTITSGGLFSWDDATQEQRVFSTVDGMSGITPTALHLDAGSQQVFVGYADGMIDVFEDPSNIRQIADIKRNTFFTQKRIFEFASSGNRLFVATEFGLVMYDLTTRLPAFTVTQLGDNPSRVPVTSVAVYEGRVWALLEFGELYSAPLDFPNLSDPFIWQRENGQNGFPANELMLEVGSNAEGLYARTDETTYRRSGGRWAIFEPLDEIHDHLVVQEGAVSGLRIGRSSTVFSDGQRIDLFLEGDVNHTLVAGDVIYVANSFFGLDRWEAGTVTNITPQGPSNNLSLRVAAGNGEVYIAPKGYDASFAPDGEASGIYYFSDATGWKVLNRVNGGLDPARVNTGFARAYYDPNTQKAYLGSWGKGLAVLEEGELANFYDCENSPLSTVDGVCDPTNIGKTRVSGLDQDEQGNLWMTIAFGQEPLARLSPEGEWHTIPQRLFPSGAHMIDMIVDDFGAKWIINRNRGLIVYNDRGTLDKLDDDLVVTLRAPEGQGNLENESVNALARDQEGFIWVGTAEGVMVFYDPFSIGQGTVVDASPPVFEGRKLLEEEVINAIAVDGGDRKWMATANGVYLFGKNGDELIHHFTTENSPLLSNEVNDVAIDPGTGEVYFSTSAGLVSYLGDATDGESGCDDVFVYPNPVRPDYEGNIVIRGSSEKALVKITTVSGMLVREINSQGGTAVWDGRDLRGNKVHSGIYLALIADEFGGYPCIGKFTVIRGGE